MITIENEKLRADIKLHGAELCSLIRKGDGQEIMWEADPAYWGKTSPILFPFIGKSEGEAFHYDQKTYPAIKHGFARDLDFTVVWQEKDKAVFALTSNEETLQNYPFPFCLELEYALTGDTLRVQYRVKNEGQRPMYFALGGHPAFACPLKIQGQRDQKRTDGSTLRLYGEKQTPFAGTALTVTEINVEDGLLNGAQYEIALEQGVLPIMEHLFDKDALCFADQGICAVGIASAAGEEYIRMEADCPVWGIWSMPTDEASYICLEPWWGICDKKGYAGTLEEKPFINCVQPEEIWQHGFTLYL